MSSSGRDEANKKEQNKYEKCGAQVIDINRHQKTKKCQGASQKQEININLDIFF